MMTALFLTSDKDPQFLITNEDYVSNNICALVFVINCWT